MLLIVLNFRDDGWMDWEMSRGREELILIGVQYYVKQRGQTFKQIKLAQSYSHDMIMGHHKSPSAKYLRDISSIEYQKDRPWVEGCADIT